jgi:hypothetical protein
MVGKYSGRVPKDLLKGLMESWDIGPEEEESVRMVMLISSEEIFYSIDFRHQKGF